MDIITCISDKKSSTEIVNKQKEQPVKVQGTINKEIENLSSQQKKSDEKRVFIVGDSIIKNVNGYNVNKQKEQPVKAQGTINKEIENLSSQQKKSDEKRVFIVGDSIIKNVNGYHVNKQKEQPVKAQGTINKEIESLSSQQKKSDEKRVFIVGDSIIKNVNGYDVSGKTEQCRVYTRPSLGAKVRCMEDHIKPVIRDNPNSSHHQLQYALGSFALITQAHASMYVSTLIQVIISCSTHWAPLP